MTQVYNYSQFEQTATRSELVLALREVQEREQRLEQENKHQRELLAETTSELYWVQSLLANANLNGNQTRVLYAVHQLRSVGKERTDGMVRMFRGAIAARAGVSIRTVSATVKKLADSGNLKRDVVCHGGGDDFIEKELFLDIPESVLKFPSGITIIQDDDSSWGGARIRTCRSCGSTELQEIHHFVCTCCGTDMGIKETIDQLETTLEAEKQLDEYPQEQLEVLAAEGIDTPNRPCIRCGQRAWLPAFDGGVWSILCGSDLCHPKLLESSGLDLSTGLAFEHEGS